MPVKPIPDGYHAVTPYLIVHDAAKALDYYQKVFGAQETFRMASPDGRIGHAEIRIGNSVVMLADEHPEMGYRSAATIGSTPVSLLLYVEDVDAIFRRAIEAGARELRPVNDQFYGDRTGTLEDPFHHVWTIATHKEDLSEEEMLRRQKEMREKKAGA
ncbi:MAG: VOC family protein [Candidatus Eisenbacteria bacterium]|nr:VOC family protein [Candidatus Eisenbacteria bacterium]